MTAQDTSRCASTVCEVQNILACLSMGELRKASMSGCLKQGGSPEGLSLHKNSKCRTSIPAVPMHMAASSVDMSPSGYLSQSASYRACSLWSRLRSALGSGTGLANRRRIAALAFESTCPTQSNKSGSTRPDGRRPGPHLIMDFPCSVRRSRMRRSSESKGSVRKREKVA